MKKNVPVAVGIIIIAALIWLALPAFAPKFQVTLKLIVEGEEITLTRVIACEKNVTRRGIGSGNMISWVPSVRAFGQRLSSGAGVFLPTPNACINMRAPNSGDYSFEPISPDFFPLIGWTSNAESKDLIELYLTKESVSGPDSRVRFESLQVTEINSLELPHWGDEFEDFRFGAFQKYRGFFLTSLNIEDLVIPSSLAEFIHEQVIPTLIPEDFIPPLNEIFKSELQENDMLWRPHMPTLSGYLGLGAPHLESAIGGYGLSPFPNPAGEFAPKTRRTKNYSGIIPLVLDNRRLLLTTTGAGYIQMHRMPSGRRAVTPIDIVELEYKGVVLGLSQTVAYVLDPEANQILLLQPQGVTFAG